MLKEIVRFTSHALEDPVFRNLGVVPKEGLHLVLQPQREDGQMTFADQPVFTGVYGSKTEMNEWFEKCTAWWKASTMLGTVDTFKVFDVPSKAIHTVSPFCIGLKRTNLSGGTQYAENQAQGKSQVYDRINSYFAKAMALLNEAEDKAVAEAFRVALNDQTLLHRWLHQAEGFEGLKDDDYVILYLNLPLETYTKAAQVYLKEKLFNTSDYNVNDPEEVGLLHGTSNWKNSFPSKKPFLTHQTATFDIAGRISLKEAEMLSEFSDLNRRRLLPNPLPIFIMEDELQTAFEIFNADAVSGEEKRKGYLEIMQKMSEERKKEVGNYYLIFMVRDKGDVQIKDFDHVDRFRYFLNEDGSPWKVQDLFGIGKIHLLYDVKDFMEQVVPPMFNNALIVRRKEKDWIYHWFDEMDAKYCETHNAYLLAMKYRKAFYDYIYKSKRQGITGHAILEILLTGILDDIRLDEYKNEKNAKWYNIRLKLNLLFGLHPYFSTKKITMLMPENITNLRTQVEKVAAGEARLSKDEHFVFAAGQVVARISHASVTTDNSYRYLEPFLAQSNAERFKLAIANFFKRYQHAEFSARFRRVCSEVLTYQLDDDLQKLRPIFLAGAFSDNLLYAEKKEGAGDSTDTVTDIPS